MIKQTSTRLLAVVFVVMLLVSSQLRAQDSDFRIGVAPHSSARFILKLYQPLRTHLQHSMGARVEILTAPDFTEFARRAMNQEYDLVITTGNQARMLQTDAGYLPLVTYKTDFKAVAVTANKSKIYGSKDLAGKNILGLNPASLVTQWGLHWIEANKLDKTKVRHVSAADSVAQLLLAGDAAVGFISLSNFKELPVETQNQLRIIATSTSLVGRVYLLNKRQSSMEKTIRAELWKFANSKAGKEYFEEYKLVGYRNMKANELAQMERYAEEVRAVLRKSK